MPPSRERPRSAPEGATATLQDTVDARVEAVLAAGRMPMAYQPVVDLTRRETVAFEALARPGHDGHDPGIVDLIARARARGVLGDLDWICRESAVSDPRIDDLPPSLMWFVNSEPSTLLVPRPDRLPAHTHRPERVVLEITEREVLADPKGLVAGVAAARAAGMRIALDDVGTEPRALSLLAVVAPDVVKLDASLLRQPWTPATQQVTDAVRAYAERTGAAIVAEGIEASDDVDVALALGATHGQGWHLGRPAQLPAQLVAPAAPLPRGRASTGERPYVTPFEILARDHVARSATRQLLLRMTRHIEDQVDQHREPLALLAVFQHPDDITDTLAARYRELAGRYAFLITLGAGLRDLGDVGVVQIDLAPADPVLTEWTVVVIGPHYACALAARSTGAGSGAHEVFDHVVSHDRAQVNRVARTVLDGAARGTA